MTRKDLGFIVFFICLGVLTLCGLGVLDFYQSFILIFSIPFISFLTVGGISYWIDGDRVKAVLSIAFALWMVLSDLGSLEIIALPPYLNLWECRRWWRRRMYRLQ